MSAKTGIYSPLKALHWPDRMAAAGRGEPVAPVHVNIDLTNICDHSCPFCMWAGGNWDLGGQHRDFGDVATASIKRPRLMALVDEFVACGVKGVEITGGGEPTIHASFPEFVFALVDAGIKVGVISNGQSWHKDETFQALARCTFVRISISSLDEAQHQKLRLPKAKGDAGSVARVLENVTRLTALPGPADRRIGIGFTIEPSTYKELPAAVDAAADAGADNLRLTYTWVDDDAGVFGPHEEAIQELVVQAKLRAAFRGIEVFGPGEWREYEIAGNVGFEKCSYGLFVCNITADGKVFPCCIMRHVEGWSYGSIHDGPFNELMLSKRRNDFVRAIDVKSCMPCIFFDKNRDLQPYAYEGKTLPADLGPMPPHAEFV